MLNSFQYFTIAFLLLLYLLIASWEYFLPRRIKVRPYRSRLISNLGQKVVYTLISFFILKFINLTDLQLIKPSIKLNFIGTFLLMDLFIYLWHRLNHEVKFFWKFHRIHHLDKEMDSSTALRFHFGELILSGVFRFLILIVFEIEASHLITFDIAVTAAAIFHHGNIKLPFNFEKKLNWFIVTPRMHEIHHSINHWEFNSNYSVILSIWDILFKSKSKLINEANIIFGQKSNSVLEKDDLVSSLKAPFINLAMTKE